MDRKDDPTTPDSTGENDFYSNNEKLCTSCNSNCCINTINVAQILHFNARSLIPNWMNSKYCVTYEPTAVCVVETWLSEDISDAEISISDHSIDRNRHGGGIGIYVQNNVMVNTPLYSPSGLEFMHRY